MLPKTEHGPVNCYHCSLPVSGSGQFQLSVADKIREFCCAGCMAVSETIAGSGLMDYYQNRNLPAAKLDENIANADDYSGFDHASVQNDWVVRHNDHSSEASFLIIGINCAACVWLIETYLGGLAGIQTAQINFSNNLMKLSWDPQGLKVSEILRAVSRIGYQAQPYTREARYQLLDQQRNQLLKRLGVSAALGMQIMVISVALYSGDWFGIDMDIAKFLKRVSLLLVLPIMAYSAKPLFQGALRSLRIGRAGMDVPICLGISLAFLASFWAVVENNGAVYFDSIAMFVFFILGARYIELNTRIQGSRAMESLTAAMPAIASRLRLNRIEKVPVAELQISDLVLVKPGSVIPVDGQIIEGLSSFNESLLSGESLPVQKKIGESVIAGSINIDQPVTVRVTQTGDQTVLSSIQHLADRAALDKPRVTRFAESIAGWFIATVLLIALISLIWGVLAGNPDWLPRTIALLVVSCPCALSLATPLALSAGSNSLNTSGIFVTRQHALETLARVDRVFFDKTGTLTKGELSLIEVRTFAALDNDQCTAIGAALESQSDHPIARSIIQHAQNLLIPQACEVHACAGAGISGRIDRQSYFLGSSGFLHERIDHSQLDSNLLQVSEQLDRIIVFLADANQLLAAFVFSDEIKPGALELINYLHREGIHTGLLSGDRTRLAENVARQLGIETVHAKCRPAQKAAVLEQYIGQGDIVAMIGDGINDAPALSLAHLSIAVARDINLTSVNADMVMMNRHIEEIRTAIVQARRTRRVIRQNVIWAVLYNFTAIPLALVGLVPPWLAAIGMSLSSVVVVLNSSRLLRIARPGKQKGS